MDEFECEFEDIKEDEEYIDDVSVLDEYLDIFNKEELEFLKDNLERRDEGTMSMFGLNDDTESSENPDDPEKVLSLHYKKL